MASQMNIDKALCQEMEKAVENLTTSGQPQLLPEPLKQLKKICRQSDDYVKKCFYLVMTQLEKDHSEIRISSVQLINELFNRSHCFRDLLLVDFQYFIDLTTDLNSDCPLPPPKQAAKKLKSTTIEMIHQWNDKFSESYKKLALGYNYLKNCKKINFQDIHARSVAEQRRDEERRVRLESQQTDRLQTTIGEMTESVVEIKTCLTQAQNCLALLLPKPEDFQIPGLTSPDIFHTENPWTRKCDEQHPNNDSRRHVNKSTKNQDKSTSKHDEEHCNGKVIKTEPPDDSTCHNNQKDRDSTEHIGHIKSNRNKNTSKQTSISVTDTSDIKTETTEANHEDATGATGKQTAQTVEKIDHNVQSSNQANIKIFTTIDIKTEANDEDTTGTDTISKQTSQNGEKIDQNVQSITENTTADTDQDKKPSSLDLNLAKESYLNKCKDTTNLFQDQILGSNPDTNSIQTEESIHSEEFQEISSESDESEEEYEEEDFVRGHGLGSLLYSIDINIGGDLRIQETPDNQDILFNLKDVLRLINSKFLPSIQKWLEVFSKNGGHQEHVKRALDLRSALEKMKEKIEKLKIIQAPKQKSGKETDKQEADDDSEDDFEEVKEKEGYEAHIPEELREEYGLVPKAPKPSTNPDWVLSQIISQDEDDPTSSMSTIKKIKEKMQSENLKRSEDGTDGPSISGLPRIKKPKIENVPAVPFGTDLYHWGEQMETPLMVRYDSEHRFWIPKDDADTVDVNALASMKSRVINFTGKFEPVKWKCRAPLPNGTLCLRMDRYKCPFHGKIVPRDAVGQPTDPEDRIRIQREEEIKRENQPQEWEDPELQADIEAATGIDLQRKGKGRNKKKAKKCPLKYPGLTDIKKIHNTSRNRLEKKVLNRNALGRVADALDKIDDKKRKDKFGNSFHYVHGPRKGSDASSEKSLGSLSTNSETVSSKNTLLATDTSRSHIKKALTKINPDMRIDGALFNPDSLWQRDQAGKMSLGKVDYLGQFISEFDPEPDQDKKKKGVIQSVYTFLAEGTLMLSLHQELLES